MKKLGSVQQDVLTSLRSHGSWSLGCGWVWDTPSNTMRIMDSLVRAGYATTTEGQGGRRIVYRPVDLDTSKPAKRVRFNIGDHVEHTNSHRQGHVRSVRECRDGTQEIQVDIDFDDIWWNSRHIRLMKEER